MILKTKKIVLSIFLIILLSNNLYLFSAPMEKSKSENHQNGWFAIISKIFNFALLLYILYYFLVKIIDLPGSFKNTFSSLSSEIQTAKESKEAAILQIQNLKTKLSAIDQEIQNLQSEAFKIIEIEKSKIVADTNSEINKLRLMAENEINWKTKEAIKKLKIYLMEEAINQSKKIISSNLESSDHKRLIQRFIRDLKLKNNK